MAPIVDRDGRLMLGFARHLVYIITYDKRPQGKEVNLRVVV